MPTASTSDEMLTERLATLHLFGDLRLEAGPAVTPVTSPANRCLLARLAIAGGATVSMQQIIDSLWGEDPPERAKQSVQTQVYRLRRLLGPGLVDSTPVGYRLNTKRVTTDLDELSALALAAIDEIDHATFLTRLDSSSDVLAGEPFAGMRSEPWVISVILRVAEERAVVLERRVRSLTAVGRTIDAVAAAEYLVGIDPFRESSSTALIETLASTGRIAESLRVVAAFRKRHIERTGLSPSPRFAAAEQNALVSELLSAPRSSTLPVPSTACVGRSDEIQNLLHIFETSRIVTLWGPGGIGKTRLAIALAEALVSDRTVIFADLSETREAERVLQVISTASGADAEASVEALCRVLDGRETLLLLDTAEHVVESVARIVGQLMRRCARLCVLVTSRERLDVPGEATFEVPPLGLAGAELFAERAVAVRRNFYLDDSLRRTVLAICDRLDGLPLAIELAAAQVAWRTPASILAALGEPLDAVDGPESGQVRPTPLAATIDWSWRLLAQNEQELLGYLAEFAAPFSLDAAEAVIDDSTFGVAHRLGALVRKSMISVIEVDASEMRYRLLDTVRAFVQRRTAASGEDVKARAAIVRWSEARISEILAHTRAGGDEIVATLRRKYRANIVGALDVAVRTPTM